LKTFGVHFGLLNTLYSGLALAGVVCVLIQSEELKNSIRKELSETRKSFNRTTKRIL
jgi:hypothetical protein